ncbi:uncharacterized protein LOC107622074 [Arachis ipaensis]|uniref:Ribonuclease H n=1 Tax=Arachis hypogaea TaxID=3818 RepID=A0A444WWR6_ARAHY|nr:uncharacterized protein LOC107622074 [Arachis ipaensis]XP_025681452.1 uncharacterized protein LOC112782967 [Arachis hypogaea]QHN80225.1 Ribonuclease H [Arachis hypogaea]RYQ81812.1 hypothetical protein Ahy_B10g100411 [Arachis hypogaea]
MNTGKYRLYAVRKGRIPGIYTNWEDCKKQVNGFPDAEFKGFRLLRDAEHWLGVVDPALTLPTPPEVDSVVHPHTGPFEQPVSLSKHFYNMHVGSGVGESSQKAVVPCSQIPEGFGATVGPNIVPENCITQFAVFEDLEVYLIRLCCQLRLDYPVFNRREFFSDNGELLHGYWVTLRSQQRDVSWIVEGGFSSDEQTARQDASFKMLGKVLSLVGKEIHDYNYRIVAALRVRVEELERQLRVCVQQRIRDLEHENRKLRSDLQKYNDLFET